MESYSALESSEKRTASAEFKFTLDQRELSCEWQWTKLVGKMIKGL